MLSYLLILRVFTLPWRVPWNVLLMQGPEFIPPRRDPPDRPPEPPLGAPPPKTPMTLAEIITLIVTNIIKLTGVVIAVIEVTKPQITPLVLIVAGFFIAGGQGAEQFLGQLFGRGQGK